MAVSERGLKFDKRYLASLAVLFIGLYIILPQFGSFKNSLHYLQSPNYPAVLVAVIFASGTYVAGAVTYIMLAFSRLKLIATSLIQLSAMFVNRLLPSGLGAVGVNYLYLRKNKHTDVQAASVITANNLLGFIGHGLLTLIVLLYAKVMDISLIMSTPNIGSSFYKVVVAVLILLLLVMLIFGRNRITKALKAFVIQLSSYRQRPKSLLFALLSSMTLTLLNVLSLLFCLYALGIHLSFVQVFIVFSFGVGAGAAIPTPGGIGGFEAGLVAGFVAYHVATPQALAAAILYRLITYWAPLLIGGIAFFASQKQLGLNNKSN